MPDSQIQLQGSLLLADPSLRDGTFNRSVILLANHDTDNGALGLILNQPTGKRVGDFLSDESFEPLRNIAVHLGGPVSREHLTFSAFWNENASSLRWRFQLSPEQAVEMSKQHGTIVRAFVGYSGWSAGQLESELRRQSWIPAKAHRDLLGLPHDEQLWGLLLRAISPYHRVLAETPDQPELN